ncbi:histidine phosphatase family protein [Saccharothrix coeruleofusca]|uniref:histidine phosphatase family protein n=1 Tax=Saccharothrix coeruleofusca TaxID=33919 RepID=UPI001670FC0F|nr:histidine phosphatase family protein [Saccharothrix coeruleofusca]MBP2334643.1 broad specificity phosphatase PhoE [Saccharothrix coeruleofusca]
MTDFAWIGLIRHGESTGNVAREVAESGGHEVIDIAERDADVPLSEQGRRQAEALARWFAELPRAQWPDVVVSSPYLRALDTARTALRGHPLMLVDERLRDRELGVLDLLTTHGVAARYPEELARKRRLGKFYYRPPGGESWADVALRLRALLGDLERVHRGRRVLLFAHEVTAHLLRYLLECVPERDILAIAHNTVVPNGSLTSWVRGERGFELEHEHVTDHLRAHGARPTESEDEAAHSA